MIKKAALGIALVLALGSQPGSSYADVRSRGDLRLWGGARQLNHIGLSQWDRTMDTYGVLGNQWAGSWSGIRFEFRPELRLLAGDSVGLPEKDIARMSVQPPSQFAKLQWKLFSGAGSEGFFSIERANVTIPMGDAELSIGRKVLSLGTLKVIPLWNRLSRPLPTAYGPDGLVFGRDQASIRYQSGNYAFFGFWVEGPVLPSNQTIYRDRMIGGEVTAFYDWIELHLMAGQWYERNVFGLAFAKDLGGVTWAGESLFHENIAQIATGLEYAWSSTVTSLFEGLYSGLGVKHPDDYEVAPADPLFGFRAQYYLYGQLRYQFVTDFTFQPSVIFNAVDYSAWTAARLEWAMNENTDLAIQGSVPIGVPGTEFSRHAFTFPNGGSLGSPALAWIELKTFF